MDSERERDALVLNLFCTNHAWLEKSHVYYERVNSIMNIRFYFKVPCAESYTEIFSPATRRARTVYLYVCSNLFMRFAAELWNSSRNILVYRYLL